MLQTQSIKQTVYMNNSIYQQYQLPSYNPLYQPVLLPSHAPYHYLSIT